MPRGKAKNNKSDNDVITFNDRKRSTHSRSRSLLVPRSPGQLVPEQQSPRAKICKTKKDSVKVTEKAKRGKAKKPPQPIEAQEQSPELINNNAQPIKDGDHNESHNAEELDYEDEANDQPVKADDGVEVHIPPTELDEFESEYENDDDENSVNGDEYVQDSQVNETADINVAASENGSMARGLQKLIEDPDLKKVFDTLLDEKVKAVKSQSPTPKTPVRTGKSPIINNLLNKSPSDTTIYRPALKQREIPRGQENNIVDRISNFVENIQMEGDRERTPRKRCSTRIKSTSN